MVNVVPDNDEQDHLHDVYCGCVPRVDYRDADTGEEYENGPLIIHNAADGREAVEYSIGESLAPGKTWTIWERDNA